jgi:hypothetical protein
MVDATEEFYPGRTHDDHDLDDFDELLKVTNMSICIMSISGSHRALHPVACAGHV